jgi:hypothetical protein
MLTWPQTITQSIESLLIEPLDMDSHRFGTAPQFSCDSLDLQTLPGFAGSSGLA